MYRVQMKNSACVGCVHLLNFHLEAPFSQYISFLNICKYLARNVYIGTKGYKYLKNVGFGDTNNWMDIRHFYCATWHVLQLH